MAGVAWDERKHPRGQPKNAGQFGSGGGGGGAATATAERPAGVGDAAGAGKDREARAAARYSGPEGQKAAVEDYTQFGFAVNIDLRSGAKLHPIQQRFVDALDSAIASAPRFREPATLWRGVGSVNVDGFLAAAEKHIGAVVESSGAFMSTTKDEAVGRQFAKNGYVMKIKARHGLDVGASSRHSSEQEVLLGRGGKFRVLGVNRATKTLEVEQV